MAEAVNARGEIRHGSKANAALAKSSTCDHFGFEFALLSEEQALADANLTPGPNQTFPFVGVG